MIRRRYRVSKNAYAQLRGHLCFDAEIRQTLSTTWLIIYHACMYMYIICMYDTCFRVCLCMVVLERIAAKVKYSDEHRQEDAG